MNKIRNFLLSIAIVTAISGCTAITEFTSSTSSTVDAVTPDITLNEFVNKRYVAIRKEAAKGHGENIQALSELMGEKNSQVFAKKLQNNFDHIFNDVKQPEDILARIKTADQYKG